MVNYEHAAPPSFTRGGAFKMNGLQTVGNNKTTQRAHDSVQEEYSHFIGRFHSHAIGKEEFLIN